MKRYHGVMAAALVVAAPAVARAATLGFVETFASPGVGDWGSSTGGGPTNPGTGGLDGVNDGYLLIASSFAANFGVRGTGPEYVGDWSSAGITEVTLWLNDVGTDEDFEIHFLISDGFLTTTWQYLEGFHPPHDCWKQFRVDMTDASKWVRTRGDSSFQDVLRNVDRVTIRHDLAPYVENPNPIRGSLGIDHITLGPVLPACHAPFADVDDDGDVDQADFGVFQACLSDPCGRARAECACFDRNRDGMVNASDYEVFSKCVSGPMIAADPACGD